MTKKRLETKGTADLGIAYVMKVVASFNCTLTEFSEKNDVGNDLYIEIFDKEKATGNAILAQVKSGTSYVRENTYFIPATKEDYSYWNSHLLPVVGIVYNPDQDTAYWIDIKEYLQKNPSTLRESSQNMIIDKKNEFRVESFKRFINYFSRYKNEIKDMSHFGKSLY